MTTPCAHRFGSRPFTRSTTAGRPAGQRHPFQNRPHPVRLPGLSTGLTSKAKTSPSQIRLPPGRIRTTYDALKPDDHAAFDALALERSTRLREMSGLSPAAPLKSHGPQSVATLHMERDRLDTSANRLESERTIVTGGAEVGTKDIRFGWRLGGFSENMDGSSHNMSSKNHGLFGTASLVKALDNVRLFGDVMAGWVHDHREPFRRGAGNSEHFDIVTTGWTAGVSAGLGYRLEPSENAAILPYLKLSYDTLARGRFR